MSSSLPEQVRFTIGCPGCGQSPDTNAKGEPYTEWRRPWMHRCPHGEPCPSGHAEPDCVQCRFLLGLPLREQPQPAKVNSHPATVPRDGQRGLDGAVVLRYENAPATTPEEGKATMGTADEKTCVLCGNKFVPKRRDSKFCGNHTNAERQVWYDTKRGSQKPSTTAAKTKKRRRAETREQTEVGKGMPFEKFLASVTAIAMELSKWHSMPRRRVMLDDPSLSPTK